MANGLPFAGWYNGVIEMQFANGTFADFRHMFVQKVKLGKMKQEALDQLDAEWERIPLDERMRRRAVVVSDSTPREVTVMSHEGPIISLKCVPDEGNNVHISREKAKNKKDRKVPLGTLTEANNPLLVPSLA